MRQNKHGLTITTTSQDAVDAYDNLIDYFFRYSRETGAVLQQVLDIDPDMVLAHCIQGYFLNLMANAGAREQAQQALASARAGAAEATPRERLHVAALEAWCAGNIDGVIAAWETLLLESPRDIIVLKLLQSAHFYRGDSANIRDCIARVLPAWDEGVPNYSHVLGMRAFGLEESGDYPAAEAAGKRAIEMNPRDPWAVHAVAHVMEMQDRHKEGVAWMEGLEQHWDAANNFRFHLWWHRSLFHLDREEYDTVLDFYDNRIRKEKTDEIRDIANAVAMLLRLEFRGVDVGGRWAELSERSVTRIDEHLMPFHDTHFLLALACGGRPDVAAKMVESMRAYVATSKASAVPVVREVCIPLAEALIAYSAGDYGRAVDLLTPIRCEIQRIGGSHAQRDLFAELLVEAALKAGRFALARALLAERSALQPGNAPVWKAYARALDGVGDAIGASAACDRAEKILAA
jgi:tetratricopeptide (TPR) repeat protein